VVRLVLLDVIMLVVQVKRMMNVAFVVDLEYQMVSVTVMEM